MATVMPPSNEDSCRNPAGPTDIRVTTAVSGSPPSKVAKEALIRGEHQGDVAFGVAGMPNQVADQLVHIGVGKHAVHQRDHGHAAGWAIKSSPDGFVL